MGKRGTDVAREAASIVLVDDDFAEIVAAIRLGRRIYDNILKALGFIFAVHVPIAGLALLPLALGAPIILAPIQIALLEMVIDPVCALAFEAEREESRLMSRPPRDPRQKLFSRSLVARGVSQGAVALALIATLYLAAHRSGMPSDELKALIFFSLLGSIIALIAANRSFGATLSHSLMRGNAILRGVLIFVAACSAVILTVPAIRQVLGFGQLGLIEVALALLTAVLVLGALRMAGLGAPREALPSSGVHPANL